jgi:MFS family permease
MSFGLVGSFVAGWLMDLVGLETCTLVTLALGMLHMIILSVFATNMSIMTCGFVVYTLFRQFLYPVFIASLSAKLGFKYFGMLSGIGFAISGLAQVGIAPLAKAVQGTCHLETVMAGCSPGAWKELHWIQTCVFGVLGIIPIWDHRMEVERQEVISKRICSQTSLSLAYGALEVVSPTMCSSSSSPAGMEL